MAYGNGTKHDRRPKKPWIKTPLIESTSLSKAAGCRIFLKLENLQPSGSFKSRGIGNLILSHASDPRNRGKRLHFFIQSGGNAGLAATTVAASLSHKCTVVVPEFINPLVRKQLSDVGARVVAYGKTINESAKYMREVLMEELKSETGKGNQEEVGIELHPYDREAIWEGVSTMIDELADQIPSVVGDDDEEVDFWAGKPLQVDAIICSVGGGGLLNGIVKGVERQVCRSAANGKHREENRPSRDNSVHIIATETNGADALAKAVEKGELITLPSMTSLATSLTAVRVAQRTLDNVLTPPVGVKVHNMVLHDSDAARGVLRLLDAQRLLVELACGVCVEAVVRKAHEKSNDEKPNGSSTPLQSPLAKLIPGFGPRSRVIIVVCGGSNVTLPMAEEWRQLLEDGWSSNHNV